MRKVLGVGLLFALTIGCGGPAEPEAGAGAGPEAAASAVAGSSETLPAVIYREKFGYTPSGCGGYGGTPCSTTSTWTPATQTGCDAAFTSGRAYALSGSSSCSDLAAEVKRLYPTLHPNDQRVVAVAGVAATPSCKQYCPGPGSCSYPNGTGYGGSTTYASVAPGEKIPAAGTTQYASPFCTISVTLTRPALAASLTWSRPPRYTNTTPGKVLDSDPYAPFTVTLDACGSTAGIPASSTQISPIARYTFTTSLPGFTPITTTSCKVDITAPLDASFSTSVTVTDQAGQQATATSAAFVKDYLVVALGDSYASGEGNPDVRADAAGGPVWGDKKCDRSKFAPTSYAATELENRDPRTSVSYVSRACSGDTTSDLTKAGGGIDQLAAALAPPAGQAKRHIDMISFSVGGDDFKFSSAIASCLVNPDCRHDPVPFLSSVDAILAANAPSLPGKLKSVIDRLRDKQGPLAGMVDESTKIVMAEYPDPTQSSSGNYCEMLHLFSPPWNDPVGCSIAKKVCSSSDVIQWECNIFFCGPIIIPPDLGPFDTKQAACDLINSTVCWDIEISSTEAQYASTTYLSRLNAIVRQAATDYGVLLASGITSASIPHGECASSPWIHSYQSSLASAGCADGQFDASDVWPTDVLGLDSIYPGFTASNYCYSKGTLHPNLDGAKNIARGIVRAWDGQ